MQTGQYPRPDSAIAAAMLRCGSHSGAARRQKQAARALIVNLRYEYDTSSGITRPETLH